MTEKPEIEEIDRKMVYTLKHVNDLRLIPWANNYNTLRRLIKLDSERGNILKVVKKGSGRLTRYEIEGLNIINYVKKFGPGAMLMTRKPKQKYGKKRRSNHTAKTPRGNHKGGNGGNGNEIH
ncbi:MAG: hypothetical protein V4481_05215 [Patescibacteria group bacterium]